MRQIPVKGGLFAVCDDADFGMLSAHSWFVQKGRNTVYARCKVGGKTVQMHRMVLGDGQYVTDHKNCLGLDCRRSNLRKCTPSQNGRNRVKGGHKYTSRYKGVSLKRKGSWSRFRAVIHRDGRQRFLGYFVTQEEARDAYDKASRRLHGSFGRQNREAA